MEIKNEVKPSTVNERVLSGSFSFDTLPDNPEIEKEIVEFILREKLKEEIKEISLRKQIS